MNIRFYLGVVLLCVSPFAGACSCVDQKLPMSEILTKYDAVFVGTVIKKSSDKWIESDFYNVELTHIKSYKGKLAAPVVILTSADEGMCGFPFEEGKDYLIFAHKLDNTNSSAVQSSAVPSSEVQSQYRTSLCSHTNELKFSKNNLKELNKIKTPTE